MKRKLVLFAILSAAILFVGMIILYIPTASANWTYVLCDSQYKYWCGFVDYSPNGSGWWIDARWHIGGWGYGGANAYRLHVARDWELYNNQWNLTWSCQNCTGWFYGSGGLDAWRTIGSSRWVNYYTAVQFQHKYETCPPYPCSYWCSPLQEHYLWDGSSIARPLGCN